MKFGVVKLLERRVAKIMSVYQLNNLVILSLICGLGFDWAFQTKPAWAAELQGKVDTTKLQGKSTDDFLQGGIKNEATLNPSLKVIPGQARKSAPLRAETPQYFYPTSAKLTQFHGNQQVPTLDVSQRPFLPSNVEQFSGSGRVGHPIAPISSYTLTPEISTVRHTSSGSTVVSSQKGVSSYVPGYEISTVHSQKGVSTYVPGHVYPLQQITTHGGIATYDPNHGTISNFHALPLNGAGHGSLQAAPQPPSKEGVTAYAPGYAAVPVPATSLATSTPGDSLLTPTIHSVTATRVPGYQIAIKTPRNGVVCWNSSYEATTVNPGLIKNTLGGMWYSERPEGQSASALGLKPVYAEALIDPTHRPLKAVALGLPGTHQIANTEITWEEWYKRVARAVYARWQNEDVGPGHATVSVTVTRDRMLVGKVTNFTPAVDVERDVAAETNFRESAVKAVNLVSQFEIPEFPPTANVPAVTFEIDMKRDVDGPVGFDVAAVPESTQAQTNPNATEKQETAQYEDQVENAASAQKRSSKKASHSKQNKKSVKGKSVSIETTPAALQMETPTLE
jgi:hypothetical protein